jgi:hypothetical protein
MTQEQIDIINRVHELYMRYGIKSVTMDDVARELGMSKKTLYQYFTDKSELVEAVIQQEIQGAKDMVSSLSEKSLDAIDEMWHIHQFMDQVSRRHSPVAEYDLKKYYPSIFNEIMKVKRHYLYEIWKSNIEKGKTEGYYRAEVNTEIIAKTNILRFESSMESSCIFSSEELLSYDFFQEIFIYHIRGIGTEKGIIRMQEILNRK